MKQKIVWLGLLVILTLAAFLRLWQLGINPTGFFCDEASIGYNAYTVLTTDKDEYGNRFPLFFRAFGEYKNLVTIYSVVPPIAFFGLSEFSVRLVSALYGILGVMAICFLGKKIGGIGVGLISALFLAISPWHIQFSRVNLEGLMPFVFFTSLAAYFWFKHWQEEKASTYCFLSSIIFFALALYSYFPARIFIPLFAICLAIFEAKRLIKQPGKILAGIVFVAVLVNPLVIHMLSGPGFARWHQVKVDKTLTETFRLYLSHFSLDFLFAKGDIDFPGQFITRHSVRGMGELYWFQLPLMIVGLFWVLKNLKKNTSKALIAWFLLYPLGTIFTDAPGPQATRSIIGVVPFQIVSALGFVSLWEWIRRIKGIKYIFWATAFFVISFSVLSFFSLLKAYPLYSSDYWGWQYGPKKIVGYFLEKENEYDQLIMTGEFNAPYIFLKFYGQDRCEKCLIGDFSLIDKNKKQLFAVKPKDVAQLTSEYEFLVKKEIFYPNGDLAFKIGEIKKLF